MPTLVKKIFLSSTLIDLAAYREAAIYACQRVGLLPVYMEEFPPDPRDAVAVCKAKVEEADLFLGLYAHRYGYIPKGSTVSLTEMEYSWALERKLPVYLFWIDPKYFWPPGDVDKGTKWKRLEGFKARIGKQHVLRKFRDPQSLKEDILLLGTELAQTKPEIPDPSASSPPSPSRVLPVPPELHSVPPYILTTLFVGRRRELDMLDAWARSTNPLLVVEAIGGMGKSALTWEWARERAPRAVPEHAGTLWWSFYEGGANTASFVREALAYVTGADPEPLRSVPQEEQTQRLVVELRRRPYLLVLDGFERLLTAYHRLNPSKLRDEEVPPDQRACTNPRTEDLLRQFTVCSPSKVLVTTRLMPSVLENRAHQWVPGVQHIELYGLDHNDGENLLRSLGVHGDSMDIRRFLRQFDNHSLLITVLAGRILDYRLAPGDFDRWREDTKEGGGLHLSSLDLKQRRTHIFDYALDGLDPKKRQLLSRIAVLNDAADYSTLSVLNPYLPSRPVRAIEPIDRARFDWGFELSHVYNELDHAHAKAKRSRLQGRIEELEANIKKEHERQQAAYKAYQADLQAYFESPEYKESINSLDAALADLENRGLLQWDRRSNVYDLHPVVRSFAFDRVEQADLIQTYERIRNHFESLPPEDKDKASELSDIKNTLQIYLALLGGGYLDRAAALYRSRVSHALLFSICSYHTVVELLTPMFRDGLNRPPSLESITDQARIASDLGVALDELGSSELAREMLEMGIVFALKSKNWKDLAVSLLNYSPSLAGRNQLAASLHALELAHDLCIESGNEEEGAVTWLKLMSALIKEGRWEEARAAHGEFIIGPPPLPRYVYEAEEQFFWFKFYQGILGIDDLDAALTAASQRKDLVRQTSFQCLRAELALREKSPREAAEAAELALEITRKTGQKGGSSWALGCLARALVSQGHYKEALRLVEEVGIPFWQAAEVYLEISDNDKAKACALRAYEIAWSDGPPHIWWWQLERSKQVLARLGAHEPVLPPFDPSKVEPIPFEAEILAAIEEVKAERAKKKREDFSSPPKEDQP